MSVRLVGRSVVVGAVIAAVSTGCSFGGLNSLSLPGAEGRGSDAVTYRVELANVGTLEPNSPVLLNDVVVGSVSEITVRNWQADVAISVKADVTIPANAVATVGQTSLLGSMHVALTPPLGQAPRGRLAPGATLALNKTSRYPSTEETLSALSLVVNGGGVGRLGDIITELNQAFDGRQDKVRDLVTQLNDFVGVLAAQRDNINQAIVSLDRFADSFAGQRDVLRRALERIPPALDVLVAQRPKLTTALVKLGTLSTVAADLIDETKVDLVRDLRNLEPTLRSLADVGPQLDLALSSVPIFPYTQNFIDRAIRGDYMNQFIVFDLTVPRLKRTLFLGTSWGQEGAKLVPAPGDPWYAPYTYDPLHAPFSPSPPPPSGGSPSSGESPAVPSAVPPPPGPESVLAPPDEGGR